MSAELELDRPGAKSPDPPVRLRHCFLPWSRLGPGAASPPVGAVALCGAVRRNDDGLSVAGYDHPEACVVCAEMAGRTR